MNELAQFLECSARTTTPDTPSGEARPTTRFMGRYQPQCLLGRGGFGEVWRAFDPNLQRAVAVKVLRPDRTWSPDQVAQFLEEGRKLARLKHPGIVAVYDFGQEDDGLYIVSELIEGTNLADRMGDGRLPYRDAALLLAEVAEAVHHAHLRGLVHRDIKPGNILVDAQGRPHLADFGLAVTEEEQQSARGSTAGTTAYMSPEQVRGDSHLLDGRTDIYSLGVVLYELLTGRRPFQGRDRGEYREQILHREPRPPRSIDDTIPRELEDICLKCLAKAVADRYTTAADLAADLRRQAARAVAPAEGGPAPSGAGPPRRPPAARNVGIGLALLASCIGLVAVASFWRGWGPSTPGSNKADTRDSGAPTHPRETPGPTSPGNGDLLRVQKLVWPDKKVSEVSDLKITEPSGALQVSTDFVSLLRLGRATAGDWELRVEFRQLNQTGRIGVFFGYREDQQRGTASYQLIQVLVLREGEHRLVRSSHTFPLSSPLDGHSGPTLKSARVDYTGTGKHTLQLRVRGDQLEQVVFNGSPVAKLTDGVPTSYDCRGAFGVYNLRSDGVFSTVARDGVPKQLQVPRDD
jgi:hypothetical protein